VKPNSGVARITGMRIALLILPVVLTVLMLAACGGKGGGGY
jgi:predicted small secreted protein